MPEACDKFISWPASSGVATGGRRMVAEIMTSVDIIV